MHALQTLLIHLQENLKEPTYIHVNLILLPNGSKDEHYILLLSGIHVDQT